MSRTTRKKHERYAKERTQLLDSRCRALKAEVTRLSRILVRLGINPETLDATQNEASSQQT